MGKRRSGKRKAQNEAAKRARLTKENRKDKGPSISVTKEGDESFIVPASWKRDVFDCGASEDGGDDDNGQDMPIVPTLRRVWSHLESRKKTKWIPTPIQLQSWPILLSSNPLPLVGIAPTGSGKTLAYGLPLLFHVSSRKDYSTSGMDGLILVPTRELATQAAKDLRAAASQLLETLEVRAVYGGVEKSKQIKFLSNKKGPLVVAATPGRLVDVLSGMDKTTMGTLKMMVVDEADRLATHTDMAQQVDRIFDLLKSKPSIIALFSATLPREDSKWRDWTGTEKRITILVNTIAVGGPKESAENGKKEDGKEGSLEEEETGSSKQPTRGVLDMAKIPSHVVQTLHVCASHKKPRKLISTLKKIYGRESSKRNKPLTLMFFGTIKTLQYILRLLQKENIVACAELHSRLPQTKREKILLDFQSAKVPALLATDVAARGLHVSNLNCVINYDFPTCLDQYVHRCGRAGRSSKEAIVYSFFHRELAPMASDVANLLRETDAWVDPNLLGLVEQQRRGGKKRRKERKQPSAQDDVADDDDPFPLLNPARIVLKRSSHVSDASSSDEDGGDEAADVS